MAHQGRISSPARGGARPERQRRERRAGGAPLALLLVLAAGCTAPRTGQGPSQEPPNPELHRGAPSWAGEELGWPKLNHIESWLASDADRYDPFWRVQAELILGEGRVSFAQRDLAAGAISPATLAERVALARAGFERVLADRGAGAAQRARAQRGLEQLGDWDQPAASGDALAVVPRGAWGAATPIASRLDPAGGSWTRITVHHSDAVPGTRLDGSYGDSVQALRKIQREHMDGRGYGDIGYHYLIDASGRVFEGRPLGYQGAHARGQNNVRNLGVCMLGDFEHRAPNATQLAALESLLDQLRARHGIARGAVHCHRDFTNTLCPGEALASWVASYERGGGGGASLARAEERPQTALARPKASPASWPRSPKAAPASGGGVVR